MGLELNPLLPRLGSLQRQLFSPYGGDGAPPPPLSNDAFLTDAPERALDLGGKVNATQCLVRCRRKKQGDMSGGSPLAGPPLYFYALPSDTSTALTSVNPTSSTCPRGAYAAAEVMLRWS